MKIWVDLCHPPHAAFFAPQIAAWQKLGHEVIVTVRERYQVADLCDAKGIEYTVIGKEYGKSRLSKIRGVLSRTMALYRFIRPHHPDVAVSQGSQYQVLASSILKCFCVFMTDYEHIFLGIPKYLADKLIFPFMLKDIILHDKKIPEHKAAFYPGLKEEVYVHKFQPDESIIRELNLNLNHIIVVLRPPEQRAHYHVPESQVLFDAMVGCLAKMDNIQIVFLARSEAERESLRNHPDYNQNFIIPETAVNGLNLIWFSDAVIGGGGTMNREAAVLGVPVYSIFKGQQGGIDRWLEEQKKMTFIHSKVQIQQLKLSKRSRGQIPEIDDKVLNFLVKSAVDIQ